jgi:molybdopterin converting factor small subunit
MDIRCDAARAENLMAGTPGQLTLSIKIVFMGELKRWAGRSDLELELPPGSTIGELAGKLFSLCGERFAQRALTSEGAFQPHVAIFIDGVQIGRLEGTKTVLTEGRVELMLLPMYEGG